MPAEKFYGYLLDEGGRYDSPVVLDTTEKLGEFIANNVEEHYELRVVDAGDCIVLNIKNRSLLYPLTEDMSPNNKWNRELKKFVVQ